jgi:hypothetical protein
MLRPWNPMKAEIESWLKTKEMEFAQKDNRNLKLTPHKYLDKYVFNDLHEVFFCDFLTCVAGVDIEVEIQPPYKSDQTTRMESYGDCAVTTS